jgi:hypothetical protein
MNTVINAPMWAATRARRGTLADDLRQLVNIAGPLASGMAVALEVIQTADVAEESGLAPVLNSDQRSCLLSLCLVSAQLLTEAAGDACNSLIQASELS